MTKDEILKISRKENSVSDERTEYIGLKGANFSISILILLWVILSRFTPMDQAAKYAMGLLVTATCCSNWLYQLIRVKTKTSIFFSILFLIAMILYLILFLNNFIAKNLILRRLSKLRITRATPRNATKSAIVRNIKESPIDNATIKATANKPKNKYCSFK